MARIYPLVPLPQYLLDLVNQVLRIRDYYTLATERPAVDPHPDNVMLPEQYAVLMNTVKLDWYHQAQTTINHIRGIINPAPAFVIDDIPEPEPDPVDYYYSDAGYQYRTKNPHPTTPGLPPDFHSAPPPMMKLLVHPIVGGGGMGLQFAKPKPKPPFPPWPPPGPLWPPIFWRPSAEETWSYCYRLNELVDYYVGDQNITPLEFQYWGYFLSEFLKNLYWLYRFTNSDAVAMTYFVPWSDLLETTLPTR
jgi:hypothetical protein